MQIAAQIENAAQDFNQAALAKVKEQRSEDVFPPMIEVLPALKILCGRGLLTPPQLQPMMIWQGTPLADRNSEPQLKIHRVFRRFMKLRHHL